MKEEATIRRGARNGRFTIVSNDILEDDRLSIEARWLIAYLLSKPDNWIIRMGDIRNKSDKGRDKVRAMVSELVEAGYLQREDTRDGGKFAGAAFVIHDEPQHVVSPSQGESVASLPQTEKPAPVQPSPDLPAPVNPPLVNTDDLAKPDHSLEREGVREGEDEGGADGTAGTTGGAESDTPDDPYLTATADTWKVRLRRAHGDWPSFVTDSGPQAEKAWFALSPEERKAAVDGMAPYLADAKRIGRKLPCSFGVYLHEKRWEKLDRREEAKAPAPTIAPPFGKLWAAVRFGHLVADGPGPLPPPPKFVASLIAAGGEAGERERLAHQARWGWQSTVRRMNLLAEKGRGHVVRDDEARFSALTEETETVAVGGDVWRAWEAEHTRRGWPPLPHPEQSHVWLPAGGPEALWRWREALAGEMEAAG